MGKALAKKDSVMTPTTSSTPKMKVKQFIEQQASQIFKGLPKHIEGEQFLRCCLTEISKNPDLESCSAVSLLGSFIQVAQLGLMPGATLGECYFIPYNNKTGKEVQLIVGYRGLIKLVVNGGDFSHIKAVPVFKDDELIYEEGFQTKLIHRPNFLNGSRKAADLIAVYAIAEPKDSTQPRAFEIMTKDEVNAIRDRAKYQNKVWDTDYVEMAKKTAVRRLCKYLPKSSQLEKAYDLEDAPSGEQNLKALVIDNGNMPDGPLLTDHSTTIKQIHAEQKRSTAEAKLEELRKQAVSQAQDVLVIGGDLKTVIGASIEDLEKENDQTKLTNQLDCMTEWLLVEQAQQADLDQL